MLKSLWAAAAKKKRCSQKKLEKTVPEQKPVRGGTKRRREDDGSISPQPAYHEFPRTQTPKRGRKEGHSSTKRKFLLLSVLYRHSAAINNGKSSWRMKRKKPLPKFWSSATWFRISQGETIFLRHSIMEGGRAIENSISSSLSFPSLFRFISRGGNLLNRASGFASAKTVSDKDKAKVYLPSTADSQLGYRCKCQSITLIF